MTGLGNIDDVYKHYLKVIDENQQLKELLKECQYMILAYSINHDTFTKEKVLGVVKQIDNAIGENKCLCWFSDEDIEEPNFADRLLAVVENESGVKYMTEGKVTFAYCRPVRRDEVTFYEDKRDD